MFDDAGYNATTWNVTIPKTNGNGINNTTSILYGKDEDVYINPPDANNNQTREFTLAN
jgi:hypothetical protein